MRLALVSVVSLFATLAVAQKPADASAAAASPLAAAFKSMTDASDKHAAEIAELRQKLGAMPAAKRRDAEESKRLNELMREVNEAGKEFRTGWDQLLEKGQLDEGLAAMKQAVAMTAGDAKAQALIKVGDLQCALGKTADAANAYASAEPLASEGTRKNLTLLAMVGKTAPDIDSKNWLDGNATALSKLTGKVVLVDFWATWCPPCRAVMPKLDELYQQHKAEGLVVMGVTHFYNRGYMVESKDQMPNKGKAVPKITDEEFPGHVAEFKKNSGISYPFVIAADDDFKNYHVSGIPTLAVVDKTGKVAMIVVGASPANETLLHAAVKNLLKG